MPTYIIEADSYHEDLLESLQNVLVPGMDKPQPVWLDRESSHYFTLSDAQRYYSGDFLADMMECQRRYGTEKGEPAVSRGRMRPWEQVDQHWLCYQLTWRCVGGEPPRLAVRCLGVDTAITFRTLTRYCFR